MVNVFLVRSHLKIPETNGSSEKVVPFSRLERSERKFVYHLQVSWVSYEFHVVTGIQSSAARQSGKFRQMVNDTYRSYRQKIPNQNFRNFFINGKQPLSQVYGNGKRQLVVRDQISPLHVVYCSWYVSKNINSSSLGLCIGIVLDCLICLFLLKFSIWIWRLPFVVNVTLSLSNT